MAVDQEFLLELKYRNDVESVIGGYVNLKRRGSNLVGLCPFHNEKTPSFTVYPENGSYYCFGCGAGGDVITFIRQMENLDYIEAVKLLADRAGLQMPESGYDASMQRMKSIVLELNREAARYFHANLLAPAGKQALDYLLNRQLSMATIRHFGLGYAPDGWDGLINHLKTKGYKEQDMLVADLIGRSKRGGYYDRFRKRVMFPIIDLRGGVIAFGGRILPGEEGAKYMNSSDTPVFKKSRNMFALNFAKNAGGERMILAEGYMDVISLHQAGFTNAVAALGTAFTSEQARLLSRYTKEVVVTLDADAAGQKATDRAMGILSEAGLGVRVLRIPDGKDPDEFIKKNGPSRFSALLDGAIGDVEYKLFMASKGLDTNTNEGKLAYLKRAAAVLAGMGDSIARDLYAGRLADKFGVSKTAILTEAAQAAKQENRRRQKKEFRALTAPRSGVPPEERQYMRAAGAEEGVLSILMLNPDYLEYVKERLSPEDFVTGFHKRVFEAVTGVLEAGRVFELSLLGDRFTPEEMGRIAGMQNKVLNQETAKTALNDCIRVIVEEKEKLDANKAGELPDGEWEAELRRLREKKQRGI